MHSAPLPCDATAVAALVPASSAPGRKAPPVQILPRSPPFVVRARPQPLRHLPATTAASSPRHRAGIHPQFPRSNAPDTPGCADGQRPSATFVQSRRVVATIPSRTNTAALEKERGAEAVEPRSEAWPALFHRLR